MKFPPCKHCKHSKSKHGKAQISIHIGWHKRRRIVDVNRCFDCDKFLMYGPTYEWEYDVNTVSVKPHHNYEGDNLALLELKSRRHELISREKQNEE